jgi:hypothetical protein
MQAFRAASDPERPSPPRAEERYRSVALFKIVTNEPLSLAVCIARSLGSAEMV